MAEYENGVTRREFDRLEARVSGLEERERNSLMRNAALTALSSAIGAFVALIAWMSGVKVP